MTGSSLGLILLSLINRLICGAFPFFLHKPYYSTPNIHPSITITYISKHIKPSQEFNQVFTYIPPRFRVIIPKPIITQLNLTIIVLPLVFEGASKILFSKALSGVAIEVLLAFPY